MILFWTPPYCFAIFPDLFGYVRRMKRSGSLLEMKSWLHEARCFQKGSNEIADKEKGDDLSLEEAPERCCQNQELEEEEEDDLKQREAC